MSKYTTEVRFICEHLAGLDESKGYDDTDDIIEAARPQIFDFEYPIFDEAYKPVLEHKILDHYYTREIGLETYGLWKQKLRAKMREIMPYYNKLYESELIEFNPLYSDTPQGAVNGILGAEDEPSIGKNGYLTNARHVFGDTDGSVGTTEYGRTDTTNYGKTTNDLNSYGELVQGYRGHNPSKSLMEFRKTFLNIDMMIINSLEDCFMQIW